MAARISLGDGEVNTAPGTAASSIPAPTKPACMGSCPAPPPETSLTRESSEPRSARTTAWVPGTRSTPGFARTNPSTASLTKVSGSPTNPSGAEGSSPASSAGPLAASWSQGGGSPSAASDSATSATASAPGSGLPAERSPA